MYLYKNQLNTVILELTLSSSLLNPNYLFEVISDMNPTSILYFTASDLSSYKCRYNRFNIIVTGSTANYTAGTFNLLSGSYKYNIYESSAITTSISATTGRIISTDKLIVYGIDQEIASVYR